MIHLFRKKNSSNIILLLVYLIAVKWQFVNAAEAPIKNVNDGYLYNLLYTKLQLISNYKQLSVILAMFLLFIQALLLSYIVSENKFYQNANYLPGMAFLLITSFLPNWNVLSSMVIANIFLLIFLYYCFKVANSPKVKSLLFNLGILLSVTNLFFEYSFIYVIILFFVLITYRPFRWFEYCIIIIGFIVPYYFLIGISWLRNHYYFKDYALQFTIQKPLIAQKQASFVSFMLILGMLCAGLLFVQQNNKRLPIQSRKVWGITLLYLLVSFFPAIVAVSLHFWIQALLPAAAFISAFYYYAKPPKLIAILHWALFAFAIFGHYVYK